MTDQIISKTKFVTTQYSALFESWTPEMTRAWELRIRDRNLTAQKDPYLSAKTGG